MKIVYEYEKQQIKRFLENMVDNDEILFNGIMMGIMMFDRYENYTIPTIYKIPTITNKYSLFDHVYNIIDKDIQQPIKNQITIGIHIQLLRIMLMENV